MLDLAAGEFSQTRIVMDGVFANVPGLDMPGQVSPPQTHIPGRYCRGTTVLLTIPGSAVSGYYSQVHYTVFTSE
jgi:hypothetical protein